MILNLRQIGLIELEICKNALLAHLLFGHASFFMARTLCLSCYFRVKLPDALLNREIAVKTIAHEATIIVLFFKTTCKNGVFEK